MKNKFVYILAFSHLCCDINQGALVAILPFLIASYHYDYATAASLVMVSNIVGSLIQPVFGSLADKKNMPYIIPLGLILAGGGIALSGIAPSFAVLCAVVMITGIGVAMFHPQAARAINKCSNPHNKAQNIGIFSFGGILGFSLGPLLMTAIISVFGLKGTLIFIIPQICVSIVYKFFYAEFKRLGEITPKTTINTQTNGVDDWGGFYKLMALICGRSIIFHGFNTFLALYFIYEFDQSKAYANTLLSAYIGVSAIFTLLGGRFADKFGFTKMIKISFLCLLPIMIMLATAQNLGFAVVLLAPLGIFLALSYSPIIALGQGYLPNRVGLASGVTFGLTVSIGGIFAPILGLIADKFGLGYVLYTLCGVCVLPLCMAFFLPNLEKKQSL
ncbi:MAG: MFS transporter [Campylobacter sp.]|nr:MFS transporter [Campylobacter sp.]